MKGCNILRLFLLTMMAALFMPLTASAYTGGLLNGALFYKSSDVFNVGTGDKFAEITDNNESTSTTMTKADGASDVMWTTLSSPVTVGSFKLRTTSNFLKLELYDSNNKLIVSKLAPGTNAPIYGFYGNAVYHDVKTIALVNTNTGTSGALTIYEFDVFSQVYDYGYMEGMIGKFSYEALEPPMRTTDLVTDADINTYANIDANKGSPDKTSADWLWFEFPQPLNIDSYVLKADGSYYLNYYDQAKNNIGASITAVSTGAKTSSGKTGVKYIAINNRNAAVQRIYDFNVYGSTAPPDMVPPGNVKFLAESHTANTVTLSWTPPPDSDLAGFKVYRDEALVATIPKGQNTYTDTGLTPFTSYVYKVTAYDVVGNESNGSTVTARPGDETPPAVPSGLSATPGDYDITLAWNPNTDDAIKYFLYMNGSQIAEIPHPTATYKVSGIGEGTYSFTIAAQDEAGNTSAQSAAVTANFVKPPNAPTSLSATASNGSASLSWSVVSGATGYNIYLNGVKVNSSPITGTGFTHAVPNNVDNKWTVTAVGSTGKESIPSNQVITHFDTISPLAPIGFVLVAQGNGEATLKWNKNPEPDMAAYKLYQNDALIRTLDKNATSTKVTGLVAETTYVFRLAAVDTSGNESPKSNPVTVKINRIETPKVTAKAGDTQVILQWDTIPGATEYRVFRDGSQIAAIAETSYTDSNLTNNTVYKYRVTAIVAGESSEPSKEVAARPGKALDFESQEPTGKSALLDMIQTGFNFISKYRIWVILVIGIIFAPTILYFALWLSRKSREKEASKAETKRLGRTLSPEEKERRARERKLNKARDDRYEQLTRMGRISERDAWVKSSGYLRPEERREKAKEERVRKLREARSSQNAPMGRTVRAGRAGREGRSPRGRE